MFYVPLAQNVDYTNTLMKRVELQSHFIGGLMLVTESPPGALEPLLTRGAGGRRSEPDDHQRADACSSRWR